MSFTEGDYNYAIFSGTDCMLLTLSSAGASITNAVIPSTATNSATGLTYNVTQIAQGAFFPKAITSVTIPNSIVQINKEAFRGCSLTSVTIPTSVTILGDYLFYQCGSLRSVTFESVSLTNITGGGLFSYCSSLTSVNIPNSLTALPDTTFLGCSSLSSFTISSNVQSIGRLCFNDCTSLNNVYFLGTSIPTMYDSGVFGNIKSTCTAYYMNSATGGTGLPTYFPSPKNNVQLKYISQNGGMATSNIRGTTANVTWNPVANVISGSFTGSLNYEITTIPTSGPYPLQTNITTQALSALTPFTSYVVDVSYNINGLRLETARTSFNINCFKSGTKILTNKGYVVIDNLRKGDLVKTLMSGYLPIDCIGKKDMYHIASKDRIGSQLYRCSQDNYPGLFEDLVITGCHSILVNNFKNREEEAKALKVNDGRRFITEDKQRLPACADDRALVYETPGNYTIFHFALENENYYENYGVYANGLLVETCSKRYLNELTNMKLL